MRGVILLLMLSFSVLADGMYVAPSTYVLPEVTAQQALLVHHEGIETMVIASTLDSESQELGWIIPVPAKPTALKKANPGVLKVFDMQSGPKIYNEAPISRVGIPLFVLLALLLLGVAVKSSWNKQNFTPGQRLLRLCGVVLFFGIILGLLGPTTLSANRGMSTVAGVTVHDQVQVGHYQTSVIEPENPQALNVWLKTNGLAELPENAVNVAKDYIAKNWVFCCFRLTRSDAGLNTPHPVQISFTSEQLIYPMQFTALTGESAHFDLFTLTDKHVVCEDLETKVSVPLTYIPESEQVNAAYWQNVDAEIQLGGDLMETHGWDQTIFGRYSGKLDFSAGRHVDLAFTTDGAYTARSWKFTRKAFWFLWSSVALWFLNIWVVLVLLFGLKPFLKVSVMAGLLILAILGTLSKTSLIIERVLEFNSQMYNARILMDEMGYLLIYEAEHQQLKSKEACYDRLMKLYQDLPFTDELPKNPYTNQAIKLEDSPGNVWVEEAPDGGLYCYFVDKFGRKLISADLPFKQAHSRTK